MRTLEELVEDFKAATFDKLRASICRQIWENAPEAERLRVIARVGTSSARGVYVHETLACAMGNPPSMRWVREALTLLNAGSTADAFWERTTDAVKQPISVTSALRLYREAYVMAAAERTSVEAATPKVLAQYDALPNVMRLSDGRFVRKPSPSRVRPGEKQPAKLSNVATPAGARAGWQSLRDLLGGMVNERLKETEPALREMLVREFERDVNVLIDGFTQRIATHTRTERKTREVTVATLHRHVVQACATLMLDPPKRGHPVDLRKADKQKKMLARQYHPDASNTEATRDAYEAVIAAFEVCKTYNAQVGSKQPDLTVHEGGAK